mmetsp:Transcript_29793/g.44041  ORF Transcript_29793/g.44041 Transcript_29793/m.44041 type:complete len:80 (-) Transcript_29793:527-766(-)
MLWKLFLTVECMPSRHIWVCTEPASRPPTLSTCNTRTMYGDEALVNLETECILPAFLSNYLLRRIENEFSNEVRIKYIL